MARDTKTSQLQVNKIIASGSTGTEARILIYGIEAQDSNNPNQGIVDTSKFSLSGIGTDVFLFVSGGIGAGISVFGGDVKISGTLYADNIPQTGDSFFYSDLEGLIKTSGSLSLSGSVIAQGGLTGSLTQLTNGLPYLVAGTAISISTGSNGQITINATPGAATAAGDNKQIQYNALGALGASTSLWVEPGLGLFVSGFVEASTGFTGSLTKTAGGTSFIVGQDGVSTSTGSFGQITIAGTNLQNSITTLSGVVAQDVISLNSSITTLSGVVATDINSLDSSITTVVNSVTTLSGVVATDIVELRDDIDNIVVSGDNFFYSPSNGQAFTSGSIEASGSLLVKSGITGALNKLPDGQNFLIGSDGLTTSTGSNGQITISAQPLSSSLVNEVSNLSGDITTLSNSVTTLSGVVATDINSLDSSITTVANSVTTLSGVVALDITELRDDIDNIVVSGDNYFFSPSNGQISTSGSLQISGSLLVKSGITGALNKLPDGQNFVVASDGLTVSTGSNGQINISAQPLSSSLINEISNLSGDITVLSNSITTLSGVVAADVVELRGDIQDLDGVVTTLSGVVATDIEELRDSIVAAGAEYFFSKTEDVSETSGSVQISGSLLVKSGITGALNKLPDGQNFIVAFDGLTTSTGSNGQISISGLGLQNSITTLSGVVATDINALDSSITTVANSVTTLSGVVATDINSVNSSVTTLSGVVATDINELWDSVVAAGAEYFFSVQENISETTGSVEITGSLLVKSGITGALNKLPDGQNFLIGSNGISTSTGSNGQITVAINDRNYNTEFLNFSGTQFFVTNNEHKKIVFVDNVALVDIQIPSTLKENFECSFVQQGIGQLEFEASGTLNYPEDFFPRTSQQNSVVSLLISGSTKEVYLFGDLEFDVTAIDSALNIVSSSIATDINELRNDINNIDPDNFWHSTVANITNNTGSVEITGSLLVKSGITGALNKLPDGQNFLIGSNGLTTSTGSNGQITVSGLDIQNSVTTLSGVVAQDNININSSITTLSGVVAADVVELRADINNIDPDNYWFSPSAGQTYATGSVQITGSLLVKSGITGALNKLPDGNNAFIGSNGVVSITGSNGQVDFSLNKEFFYGTTRNFTGSQLWLSDVDNNSLIYVSNSNNVKINIPNGLTHNFEVALIQKASGKLEFSATGSLLYAASFLPTSSQENSLVGIIVSGTNVHLVGDLKVKDSGFVTTVFGRQGDVVALSGDYSANEIDFDPTLTNLSSSNVQTAIQELSSSVVNTVTTLSGVVATDINLLNSSVTNVSNTVNYVSNSLFFPTNVLDSSGNRTLSNQDSGRIIFMNGTSTNMVRVPPTLRDGFSTVLVQSSSIQIVVIATASLKYPSTTFTTGSAEQNSMITLYSGSAGLFLGGDLELV
jgi:hypothetical protein